MAALIRRLRSCRRGSELIEFAVVTPLLLLTLAGMLDFGFLFMRYQVVANAAREGARVGILPGYTAADIQQRVTDYIKAGGLSKTPTTTVTSVTLVKGMPGVRVLVEYPHTFSALGPIGKLFGGEFGTITLRSAAVMKLEN